MHFLYIIYSPTSDKYYTGETKNVPPRLELHNSHKTLKFFTKAASDWEIKLIFNCKTKEDAVHLERFLKKNTAENSLRRQSPGLKFSKKFSPIDKNPDFSRFVTYH